MDKNRTFLMRHGRKIWMVLSVLCILAVATCVIVNLAVSGGLEWALYPMLCVTFGWAILSVFLLGGRHRLQYAIGSLSVFIFPFLMLLDAISPVHGWAKALGFPIAGVSVVYLAAIYAILRYTRWSGWNRAAVIALITAPMSIAIEIVISRYLGSTVHWSNIIDVLSCGAIAAVLYGIGKGRKRAVA